MAGPAPLVLPSSQVRDAVERAVGSVKAQTGVDVSPALVLAIIDRESSPRYNTRSYRQEPDGRASYGLMQILDTTARDLGFDGDPTELYNPVLGVFWGTLYLARQLKRYGGDVTKAVAAYNAGSARPDGRGGYVTTAGYVDYVLGRLRYWTAAIVQHPGESVAVLALLVLVVLRGIRGRR